MENIDKIFFINLEKRKDRLEEFLNEMDRMGIPKDKVERYNACYTPHDGTIGCTVSHLEAVKLAKERNYKNILIFEDDFEFIVDKNVLEENFSKFFNLVKKIDLDWKVIMLSYNLMEHHPFPKDDTVVGLTNNVQTASGYIVNSKYYDKIIKVLEFGLEMLKKYGQPWNYMNDQIWKHEQQDENWFYFLTRLGKQRAGYSDLGGRVVDHGL